MGGRAAAEGKKSENHPRHVSIALAMINCDYFLASWVGATEKEKILSSEEKCFVFKLCRSFSLQSSGAFNLFMKTRVRSGTKTTFPNENLFSHPEQSRFSRYVLSLFNFVQSPIFVSGAD